MSTVLSPVVAGKRESGRDYLSYSAIALYQACPLRYYFKYVAGLPEETVASSLVFGACMHKAVQYRFEQLLAGNPVPDLDTLLAVYQDAWRSHEGLIRFGKGEDINTLGQLADRLLRVFQESDFASPSGTIIGVEEELRGELIPGLPDLLARVDLIVDAGDFLEVSDFKTARSQWSQDHVADAASQLLLYHELVKELADGRPVRLSFAVLTKTKAPELAMHPVPSDPKQIERTKRVVENVWRAIEAGLFYPSPSPLNCSSCPYRQPCQEWQG